MRFRRSCFFTLLLPLRAETLRSPGGFFRGLVTVMLGRMKGEALDARGYARLGNLRGCLGAEEEKFRGTGEEVDLRALAWGRSRGHEPTGLSPWLVGG